MGYQVVLVDAGIDKVGLACVPVGTSVLVFTSQGLIAIAYEKGASKASKLDTMRSVGANGVLLSGPKGALANLVFSSEEVRLLPSER
jgi:hypothetical protein